jgi:hypothetical protein
VATVPEAALRRVTEATDLAKRAGLKLDEWQRLVLEGALGVDAAGQWRAREVAMVVPRQNGKGAVLEARELAGLFLFGERLIIHSAHQFDTSLEAFRRLLTLIEDTPELDAQVAKVKNAHGEEGIQLRSGQRIRFRTRTKGGGRGFSCDCLVLDEAMFLAEFAHAALLPTLSARPNPQVWYAGSAVDQEVHEHGVVLARLRERGIKGDSRLAYFDWSLPVSSPGEVTDEMASDPEAWAVANPALHIRISPEQVELEHRSLDPRGFAVERLGVGDWPSTDGHQLAPFAYADWVSLRDLNSSMGDPVVLAFDVSPDRSAAVAAAGLRPDGLLHVEIVDHRSGTRWLPERLFELCEGHEVDVVVCDGFGPAGSIVAQVEELGVPVVTVAAKEHTQACGLMVDLVRDRALRHLGSVELAAAIRGARTRPLGDSWAWSRRASTVDISPLVATTLALARASTLSPNPAGLEIF